MTTNTPRLLRRTLAAAALCLGPATAAAQTNPPATPVQPPVMQPGTGVRTTPTPRPVSGMGSAKLWWNDTIFYEVFIRSFADSDVGSLAGDGIGDIQGLIDNLDYINDGKTIEETTALGATGLWLMPIHPSPSYHGYDITDYRGINPQYGTLDDFRRLMNEAHKRGVKVIIDFVPNHTSDKHPWFLEAIDPKSPRHDWFIWSATDPGWQGLWNQKVWHQVESPTQTPTPYYFGLFSPRMPDLNFRNPGPTKAMYEVAEFWLGKPALLGSPGGGMGADGLRLDAIRHLIEDQGGKVQENTPDTYRWLREFHRAYKKINPAAMTVGEVWAPSNVAASYVGDHLDLAFEFDLAAAMIAAARDGKAEPVRNAMKTILEVYPPNQYATFLSNHDQTRVMTQCSNRLDAAKCAAFMLLTGPGVPFVYYGEEIGMTGDKPDENLRTPMQWTAAANAGFTKGTPWRAVNAKHETVNVEVEGPDGQSLFNHYRRLMRVRRQIPALMRGTYIPLMCDHPAVYACLRTLDVPSADGKAIDVQGAVCVINLSDQPVTAYGLSVHSSPLRPPVSTQIKFGTGIFMPPRVDKQGGFGNFRPLLTLRPRTGYVVTIDRE